MLFVDDPDLRVYLGDAVAELRELPEESVQTVVTSPPFFGLRDYEADGQIGLEPTLDAWVEKLVAVFAEVRRVLRPDGTLWVECGDSYGSGNRTYYDSDDSGPDGRSHRSRPRSTGDVKPKDLYGAPFELALALRRDGWYWRSHIVWEKPDAMPESAKDRPTVSHSNVFLFSRSARYFYDRDAIAEPAEWSRWGDQSAGKYGDEAAKGRMVKTLTKEEIRKRFGGGRQRGAGKAGAYKTTDERSARFQGSVELGETIDDRERLFDVEPEEDDRPASTGVSWHDHSRDDVAGNGKQEAADGRAAGTVRLHGWMEKMESGETNRNARTVWRVVARGNRLAVCSVCEAYWDGEHPKKHCGVDVVEHFAAFPTELARRAILAGSAPGDVVLDPFGGSGTTAVAARATGRRAILVELRKEYAVMIRERLSQQSLFAEEGEKEVPA